MKVEAPERIWATVNGMRTSMPGGGHFRIGGWSEYEHATRAVEYVRADKLEELATALAEKDKEIAELRDALAQIDALDPEEHAAGFSVYALRGVVERMGEIARAALKEVGDVG